MEKELPKIETHGDAVVISFNQKTDTDEVNKIMAEYQDAQVEEVKALAVKLGVSEGVAGDIQYLRTRSRWTQDLENQIIVAAKAGQPIDSCKIVTGEWPE